MKVGTGTTAPAAGDTDLATPVAGVSFTVNRRQNVTHGVDLQALIGAGEANGNELAEVGTFEGTTLIARALISPTISKTGAIQVTLSHEFTFSDV